MRRVLLVLLGLGLVAACGYVVTLSVSGSDDAPPEAIVMPFPRALTPLPVPEVRIGEEPWQDPLPPIDAAPLTRVPEQIPKFVDGLKCDTVQSPDTKGQGGTFRACRTE